MATKKTSGRLAEVEDLEVAYEGTLDANRRPYYEDLIARASRLLAARRPSLLGHIESGRVEGVNARDAVINAVLRVVRNPEGVQSETEGSYLYSLQRDVAGGKLYFTGDDLALVEPAGLTSGVTRVQTIGVRLGLAGVPR